MLTTKNKQEIGILSVFLFIGALLFSRLSEVTYLIFDEVHYIPAAKALILGEHNLNWEQPPLGKLILGAFWWVFSYKAALFSEPLVFRICTAFFGMGCLITLYFILQKLDFDYEKRIAAILLTAVNFLWFALSKTVVLEVFYVFFGMLGVYFTLPRLAHAKKKAPLPYQTLGWFFLGLSCASKWSGLAFVLVVLFLQPKIKIRALVVAALSFAVAYCLSFLPLFFLKKNGIHSMEEFFQLHVWIFQGLRQIPVNQFDYASSVWDWPFLLRPLWFYFEPSQIDGRNYNIGIWCGGNPVLFSIFIVSFSLMIAYQLGRFRKKQKPIFGEQAHVLLVLYLVPLIFWCLVPRGLKIFYYYLPSSMFLGPIVVWSLQVANLRLRGRKSKQTLLWGSVALCILCFFYFLPILDGKPILEEMLPNYLWFDGWR